MKRKSRTRVGVKETREERGKERENEGDEKRGRKGVNGRRG